MAALSTYTPQPSGSASELERDLSYIGDGLQQLLLGILKPVASERPSACEVLSRWHFKSKPKVVTSPPLLESTEKELKELKKTPSIQSRGLSRRLPREILKSRTFCDVFHGKRSASNPLPITDQTPFTPLPRGRVVSYPLDSTSVRVDRGFFYDPSRHTIPSPVAEAVLAAEENMSNTTSSGSVRCVANTQPLEWLSAEDTSVESSILMQDLSRKLVPSILNPRVYEFAEGTLRIIQTGHLLVYFPTSPSLLAINTFGTKIWILNPSSIDIHQVDSPSVDLRQEIAYNLEDLPPEPKSQFATAMRLLEQVKSRTPMLILHIVEGKCMLMCNSPSPDVEILLRPCSNLPNIKMMHRVRFTRRTQAIEFAQRTTSGSHSEWQKRVYSCQIHPPFMAPEDQKHLNYTERRSLKLLQKFLRICAVVENKHSQ
ncbi:hypothetical protein FA15DRAFT_105763 [Coprinopsis marcescibilis]|uniref:Cryptic POLO box 2 (CPB2) domain-containing protein n=1 Tax=Coprinopsis marcescibilis TaxID=230819 RepID=A0A5C3L5G8_COPMA|nr:hypothetical protein FA15DRAFT_105763 [Coprinopsis marcescibilis]